MRLAVVVGEDPLDRRGAPVEHPRVQVGVRARAGSRPCRRARNVTPSTSASSSPARGSRQARRLGRRLGASSRVAHVTRPCSAMMSSGVAAAARAIISRTAGSWLLDLLALGVAQRLHVQQQRLLDLGRVEQAAAALRRDLRMVRQHDRGARAPRRRRRVASTGKVLTLVARALERRDEPPAGHAQDRVRRDQRPRERAGAVEPARDQRAVLDPQHDLVAPTSSSLERQRQSRERAARPPSRPALARSPIAQRADHRARRAPTRAARPPGGARRAAARNRTSAPSTRVRRRLEHAAQLEVVERARERRRVHGRIDDPERRRRGVLGRPRRVRVERVALAQQRVDELPRG